jgi:transmembrane sensor
MIRTHGAVTLVAETAADAAARWFALRRRKADAGEDQQFARWLESDPVNRRAYDEVTRSWEIAALAAADQNVIAMRSEALMIRARPPREYFRVWGAAATAATVLLAMTGIYFTNPGLLGSVEHRAGPDHMILRTGIGQQATATLEDGSRVTLNTNTAVEVNYSKLRRDIRLIAGQALFKVAHNAARPFIVAVANREVVAVGTEFEVRLDGEKVRVALLEGRVRVQPLSSQSGPQAAQPISVLAPGEQLVAGTAGDVMVKPAKVEELVSWETGRVRFDNTPLSEAIAEMNRYNHTPIVIADPSLARIRISGTFRAGQSWPFAEAVAEAFAVRAESSSDAIRLHTVAKS